jgi:hypothetical protein
VLCYDIRKAIREQKSSSIRRVLKPLSLDRQIEKAIEQFRQHKQNVEEEARACHMIEEAEERASHIVLLAAERRSRLLARLSNVDNRHRHRKLKDARHEGTGSWLSECAEYSHWQGCEDSAVLCCYGIRK